MKDKSIKKKFYIGHIKNYSFMTPEDYKKQVFKAEIEPLDHEDRILHYNYGDIVLIYPKNSNESVKFMLERYNLKSFDILKFTKNPDYKGNYENEYPDIITAGELFTLWLNIESIPMRYFCYIASKYTDDEVHMEKLELFASKTTV